MIVLGGRATIRGIAQSFENVFGVKPSLESRGSLDDLYKTIHELRQKTQTMSLVTCHCEYFTLFTYRIGNETNHITSQVLLLLLDQWPDFVGTDLDNSQYPEVKPVDWETFMTQWPLEQLSTAFLP